MQVLAVIAEPYDPAATRSFTGFPFPCGALETVLGGVRALAAAGRPVPVYFSDAGYRSKPADDPARTWFPGLLDQGFAFQAKLFDGPEPAGRASVTGGAMVAIDLDGAYDWWLGLVWAGRRLRIWRGDKDAAFADFELVFDGRTDGIAATDSGKTIRLRSQESILERALTAALFAGTGAEEGTEAAKGLVKPWPIGRVANGEPVLLDALTQLYALAPAPAIAGADFPVAGLAVKDQGVALTDAGGGPYVGAAALLAAPLAPGMFVATASPPLLRLGAAAAGTVTVDHPRGFFAADTVPNLAKVVAFLVGTALRDDSFPASRRVGFGTLEADLPDAVGILAADLNVSFGALLDALMAAVAGWWFVGLDGRFHVGQLKAPEGPADLVLSPRNMLPGLRRAEIQPAWQRRLGYDRVWRVQTADEVAGSVDPQEKQRLGQAYRFAPYENGSVKQVHLDARAVEIGGYFAEAAPAIAEVARQSALFGVERNFWTVPVKDVDPFDRELGSTVEIRDYDRFGLDPAGSFFVLTGIQASRSRDRTSVTLTLWG